MGIFDPTKPTGSDPKAQGDDQIRELKGHIVDMLEVDGSSILDRDTDPAHPLHHYRGGRGITGDRPAAGLNGLYFDTTRQVLQRDNGSTWDDIATNIPATTKAIFFQAAAPTGWVKDTDHHGKAIRVVTDSNGGTAGGTADPADAITLAHDHDVNAHTHDLGNHTHSTPAHQHVLDYTLFNLDNTDGTPSPVISANSDGADIGTPTGVNASNRRYLKNSTGNGQGAGTSGAPSSNTSGSSAPGTSSELSNVTLAHVNAIICSKS